MSGSRAVNGCEVSPARLTCLAGCVHQEDLLIGTLTVREHLLFQVTEQRLQSIFSHPCLIHPLAWLTPSKFLRLLSNNNFCTNSIMYYYILKHISPLLFWFCCNAL